MEVIRASYDLCVSQIAIGKWACYIGWLFTAGMDHGPDANHGLAEMSQA